MERVYEAPKDTAKKIRAILKIKFQGTKFSVKTELYSQGASINVSWTDGPMKEDVSKVVKPFAGASFDGMTDSMDFHPRVEDGKLIQSGANFVMTYRASSGERA